MEEIKKENTQNNFLSSAKLGKLMLKFCIPCILSLLISALYNIVDQLFVGQNVGLSGLSVNGEALTASGVVFPIFIIAQAFAWCLGDGTAAYLNICQGRGQADSAHKAIGFGIVLTVLISGILMAVFYPLKEQILWLFGAEEEKVLAYAVQYFDIILGFFPVFMAMNMINAVIRADGSPAWSMASMLSGAIINIILDPIFLYVTKWGLAGAAWATVIGQCVSCIISVVYLFRSKTFKLKAKSFLPCKEVLPAIKLGLSSFITQMTIVIISLVCSRMLVKYGLIEYNSAYMPVALIGVESKVFTVVVNIVVGLILGCQPILSYNLGAKNYKRVKQCYLYVLICTVIICLFFTILFEAYPDMFVRLFIDAETISSDPTYLQFGRKLFRIFLMFVTFTCTIKMTSIFFQALGKPVFAIITSLVRDIVCFVPLVCTLPIAMGIDGCLWAAPIADAIAIMITVVLTIVCFRDISRMAKKTTSEGETEACEPVIKPSVPGVIITIGREHGSSGKQIGKIVADRLGIPFYYKEMTALAAKESGLDKEFISGLNSNSPNFLYDLYLSCDPAQQAITAQDKIIKKIAESGSCVIVGRAADYVLRDNPNVVKVFIHAPEEYRIKRIMEVYGDDEATAKKQVSRSDNARAAYYKNVTLLDWGDAKNYDLCVNSSTGVEAAADVICDYIKNKN